MSMFKPTPEQARMVGSLKRMQMREMPEDLDSVEAHCDLCDTTTDEDHRHLLQLDERRIVCVCEACWALRSGDAEFRPTGSKVTWLGELVMPSELWARFHIPIGLAFFLKTGGGVVAFYPSPLGATESELDVEPWTALEVLNPKIVELENEAEALIIDNMGEGPARAVMAPTDEAYRLVGLVKANWSGISGGTEIQPAIDTFFDELQAKAA